MLIDLADKPSVKNTIILGFFGGSGSFSKGTGSKYMVSFIRGYSLAGLYWKPKCFMTFNSYGQKSNWANSAEKTGFCKKRVLYNADNGAVCGREKS